MSEVTSVRLEYTDDAAIGSPRPRVSWVATSAVPGWTQHAAELRWRHGEDDQTMRVDTAECRFLEWPFDALTPRESGTLQVRVLGGGDDAEPEWSAWSQPRAVSAAFLGEGEWQAHFIGLPEPSTEGQPFRARTTFSVRPGLQQAVLYATAHGAYQALVNGREVDDTLLKPGWTSYQFRLLHETTDVTSLVREGENVLAAEVAGAWYCEQFGFGQAARPFYGPQPSFSGQLLLSYTDGSTEWVRTTTDWQVSAEGPLRSSGIYPGEEVDARRAQPGWAGPGFDASAWSVAAVMNDHEVTPTPRIGPPVRVTGRQPVAELVTSPSGATLLDFGQNLVGRVRIRVQGPAGTTITLRHAEVLEDGELGTRPLRAAKATDTYTLAGDGVEEWAPQFTFHGFRYAEVTGWPGDLNPADIVAEVIGSDMVRTGWFECSDELVNRLHENVVWSMKGNFLSLPTDCPQRDERLGWTGDIQVFAPTASYLYDCDGFLASWLIDLALEQQAGGSVPFVVPNVLPGPATPAAGWGDAAVVVPWVLWQRFGDRDLLITQYPSMKAWVDQLTQIAGKRHLWEGGFQFGDWVDPDAPPDQPAKAKADRELVASAYLFRSTDLVARAAKVLGHDADQTHYAALAEQARQAWLAEYVSPAGRIISDAQTSYALAIGFGIATGELAQRMGDRLAWLVRRDGYRISTGFLGTPEVADALTMTGGLRQAGRLLMQTQAPSWLYPVTMGATTIWERWDSLLPDGSINPGEMTSFNHYALGAVADWLHRVIGGLAPAAPGYAALRIEPRPIPNLEWATTLHTTPRGVAKVSWRRFDDQIQVDAEVPTATSATVVLPDGSQHQVRAGEHSWTVTVAPEPSAPPVSVDSTLAQIIDDEPALAALMSAIATSDSEMAKAFFSRAEWIDQPLSSLMWLLSPQLQTQIAASFDQVNESRGG